MFTPDNEQRAERAQAALSVYADDDSTFVDDDANVTDLLTDLMHLMSRSGRSFDEALRVAEIHYNCELTGKE